MITQRTFANFQNCEIIEYTIENKIGTKVVLLNYGALIKNIFLKDKYGKTQDVIVGFDTFEEYVKDNRNHGVIVGRYANRIINAEFELNSKKYYLEKNDNNHHLHGTFAHRIFDSVSDGENSVIMSLVSTPEEEGYPGTLTLEVKFTLTEDSSFQIDYKATTDEDTVINVTSHPYFNLAGQNGEEIGEHILQLTADRFTPITSEYVPTGEILGVENTPFDFRQGKKVGDGLDSNHEQIKFQNTFDHNMIFPEEEGEKYFATLISKESGIVMDAYTTQVSTQLFVKNTKSERVKEGIKNKTRSALCLEAQHYPASPNFKHFPSTVLKKDEIFRHRTQYKFRVEQ